ncbi:hypothetical protein DM860_002649 [Cuscuta australis]|uniref:DUF3741 domain-containing protein n=1 Tax=Cuscuta australis TaxID=267555 RepID=A0A328D2N7_9ASTE|nr:hypothetical protein DM860_002649 [Cuscuta australis]
MRDLSFFLLKNAFGAKIRKGFKNFCNNDGSTSTLNQQSLVDARRPVAAADLSSDVAATLPHFEGERGGPHPTLEEMLLQLDMEERLGRDVIRHRMSCVNSSDILRAARSALDQYPRFSLDGKDALYRSSFRNRETVDFVAERRGFLPSKIGGEQVMWCKPGVVAKLMGLDALPVPMRRSSRASRERMNNGSDMMMKRRQNLRRRSAKMEGRERRDTRLLNTTSCSKTKGYCVVKPIAKEIEDEVGWAMRGGIFL